MIKNLIEAFNLIRDDPYLNRILNSPRYQLTASTFFNARSSIRIIPGTFAGVFPEAIDIRFTEGYEELLISLPRNSEVCVVTRKLFDRLIDSEIFIECVNTLFEYKDFFRLDGTLGEQLILCLGNAAYPCVAYVGEVSKQSLDAQLLCDSTFSLRCIKQPGWEPDFGITNGAAELSAGSCTVTTCDESDFINKFKAFLKPLEIEPFIAKHEHDAKIALDKLLSGIESNLN